MTLGRKIRRLVGGLFVGASVVRLLTNFAYWIQHPELTEMQVFLTNWKQYVGAVILLLVGTAILSAWRPFPPYPKTKPPTNHHYVVRRHGKTSGGQQ